jgi:hypothetical protein
LSLPDGILLWLFCLGIDINADLCLDMNTGGRFTHKSMMEQAKFLENFINRHTSSIIRTKPFRAKVMSSVEEYTLVKSKHMLSVGSTHEPSPEPWTPKERVIHPLEFPIEFEDYGNTSKLSWHEKHTKQVSPRAKLLKEWLMEVKRSSEAIQILSPSTAMPCSLRGTVVEALYNPTVGTSIMLELLAKNLLGNMPLVPTNKLLKVLWDYFSCVVKSQGMCQS